ncbi:flagellar filament capping protein FliD [Desulfonatronovibrio hydrogenovorans]|uniref:flagellar filament capping protein FliD n=1 Tax=Desulfonatronovibrio hydrogenovorans TaxID=53245 RepID=UPI00048FD19A|nr:flagellar filament capping protein FliD [Desulfonatronovibrio hydrogenovorans]
MPELTENLISGGIHFTGLGSGTDFNEMIDKLVQIENRRVARLELWKKDWENKNEGLRELNTAMVSLQTSLAGMNSIDKFFVKSTTSSNEGVLTASAGNNAEEGTHNIEVGQLAQNHIMFSSQGFSGKDATVNSPGENTFSYTYAGKEISVHIPDNTTLDNFVNIINTDPNNPGIKASLVNDGSQHFLQIRGMDLGADKAVTINDSTTITAFYDGGANFITSQTAQNAQLKVNGWPQGEDSWIERSTNSISDVIQGITFNLYNEGSAQISVANDPEAVKEQIYSFIDQVNEVLSLMNNLGKVSESGDGSVLTGNYGLQMVQGQIKSILSSIGIGFDRQAGGDPYPSFSTVGITTDVDRGSPTFGLLKIDEAELDKALASNPQAVAELFSADLAPSVSSSDFRIGSLVRGITQPGNYQVEYEVGADGNIIPGTAFIDGKKANIDGNYITSTEGGSRGLSIQVDNLTPGQYSGNVRLKSGKANELQDALKVLTDPSNGTLNIIEKNYNDIIKNIDKKIEFEQTRLERYERNLRMQFARLEELLGFYDGLQNSMNAQLNMLSQD